MNGLEFHAVNQREPVNACSSHRQVLRRGLRRAITVAVLSVVPLLLVPVVLMPCSTAFGQEQPGTEPLPLTLDDAVRLALQNNRSLIDARLARKLQEFALDVAGDRYRPTVTIGPSTRVQKDQDWTTDASVDTGLQVPTGGQFSLRYNTLGNVSLGFSQPLLKGFGVSVDTAPLRLARLTDEINVLAFREVIASVVDSTIRAWRDLVRARRQLEIGESSLERAQRQLEINRTLIEAGQMAAREILQSEANVADRELALVQSRNRVTTSNFGLIDVLDIDGATEIRPVEMPVARRPVVSLEKAIDTALRHASAHALALLAIEITAIELEVAENKTLWDLTLDTEASRNTGGGRETTNYSASLRLTIPLWERSPELGLTSAKAGVRRAEHNLAEVRQTTDIAVRQVVHDVEVGLRRIGLAREARSLAEEKLEIERSKLQQGLSSIFQLSRFEEDLVNAQNAEVDALIDYENALTALDRTLGTTLKTWNIEVERVGG